MALFFTEVELRQWNAVGSVVLEVGRDIGCRKSKAKLVPSRWQRFKGLYKNVATTFSVVHKPR